eukprot:TRINITY_DN49159_c0_g1_i1.p1 TRINITY_DN49159_c0_g1~~TRINITY_DN49159_c0_g1_i1.p1  ORF type:complete len:646 (+),score=73.99 TRINITY_DN49159_c0_g1_i1:60-1940(+)
MVKHPSFTRLSLSFSFLGSDGDRSADALVTIPKRSGPHPVAVFLGALSDILDFGDDGRHHFCREADNFVFITPKGQGVLTTHDPDAQAFQRRRYDEEALFFLLQRCLVEIERNMPNTIDVSRIAVAGLSLGAEAALNLASVPGAGRILAGIAPVACRGHDHLVYTETALMEMRSLPIWGVQVATDNRDYRMKEMLQFIGCYGDFLFSEPHRTPFEVATDTSEEMRSSCPLIEHGAPPQERDIVVYPEDTDEYDQSTRKRHWEYWREIRKFKFGSHVCFWEMYDSRSDKWTGWDSFKHHDAWTAAFKEGVGKTKRTFATWARDLEPNPQAEFIWGEATYQVELSQTRLVRPLVLCGNGVSPSAEVAATSIIYSGPAQKTARDGERSRRIVGSHPLWRYCATDVATTCANTVGSIHVGDCLVCDESGACKVERQPWVRGKHLKMRWQRRTLADESLTESERKAVEYYRWWIEMEIAKRAAFHARCCGQFEVAVDYNLAAVLSPEEMKQGKHRRRLLGDPLTVAWSMLRSSDHAFCIQPDVVAALSSTMEESRTLTLWGALTSNNRRAPAKLTCASFDYHAASADYHAVEKAPRYAELPVEAPTARRRLCVCKSLGSRYPQCLGVAMQF